MEFSSFSFFKPQGWVQNFWYEVMWLVFSCKINLYFSSGLILKVKILELGRTWFLSTAVECWAKFSEGACSSDDYFMWQSFVFNSFWLLPNLSLGISGCHCGFVWVEHSRIQYDANSSTQIFPGNSRYILLTWNVMCTFYVFHFMQPLRE